MIVRAWRNIFRSTTSLRFYSDKGGIKVLGIETSCDDTSAAVVNESGEILGEGHFSQYQIHLEAGGVLPTLANKYHSQYVESVVKTAMKKSHIDFKDLDAIAVTVKPGLIMCLIEGLNYAKELCHLNQKPIIPVHHMKAHALTARMFENIQFPFLVLLLSGGHCLLTLAKSVDEFVILGNTIDNPPGVIFDRLARRAKLQNLKEYRKLVGGAKIEAAAEDGNPNAFYFSPVLPSKNACDFSFAGLYSKAVRYIINEEETNNVQPDEVIPAIKDLCASFQFASSLHICHKIQFAMEYIKSQDLIPSDNDKYLVVSGGVASNKFIAKCLRQVCELYDYKMASPPRKYCTDNGAMIAWNGVELLRENFQPVQLDQLDTVECADRCPIGKSVSEEISKVLQSLPKVRLIKSKYLLECLKEENATEGEKGERDKSAHKSEKVRM